jgi:hypothetical protein
MASTTIEDSPEHTGTKPTSNLTDDHDPPPPYKYDPLPTATSIRLLKLLHSPAGQIRCELNTVDLDDDIKFDALSYTWGNPITIYERPDVELRACDPDNVDEIYRRSGATEVIDSGIAIVDHEALNYRYGHPSIPYEEVSKEAEKTHNILCSGSTILVTENLFEALYVFRRLIMKEFGTSLDGHPDFEAPPLPRPLSIYIWIDAICINQDDIFERNSQVMVMGRIYSLAQNVFCWIGKEDAFSKLGLHMLCQLFGKVQDDPSIQDQWYRSLSDFFRGTNPRDWLAFFALFQRLWFGRAWIVQELVFASQLTMICGYDFFLWSMVQSVLRFMRKTRLDKEVSKMVQNLIRKGPLVKELRMIRKAVESTNKLGDTHLFSTSSKYIFSVNPAAAYALATGVPLIKLRLGIECEYVCKIPQQADSHISGDGQTSDENKSSYFTRYTQRSSRMIPGIRDGYDWYNDAKGERGDCLTTTKQCSTAANPPDEKAIRMALGRIIPGPQPPISLLSIISTFRMCSASDPRDKIFAFLGLAEKGRAESTLNHHILKADYRSSVQDVYITATVSMLETSGLAVLSNVQDPSLTQVSGLPSWVPDFSVDLGRLIHFEDSSPPWAASGKQRTAPFTITGDNHLVLEGTMIDTTSEVTSLKGCYFERIAGLALETPAHYLNNQGIPPTFTSYPSDVSETGRKPLLLPTPEDPDFPSISRVEALWRTLTLDSFEGVCPAPARCGFGFSDWVSLHLERAQRSWELAELFEKSRQLCDPSQHMTTQIEKYFFRRMSDKFYRWAALNAGEVGGFYTLEEIQIIKQTSLNKSNSGSRSEEGAGNLTDTEIDGHGLRYLPDPRRVTQVMKRETEDRGKYETVHQDNNFTADEKVRLSAFESRMREVKTGRRLLRTEKGYLGMGSVSVEPGDQVWVLKGGDVPLILRPVKDGRYRLIGEAYVHGIMRGEALRVGCTFREVILE